MSNHSNRGILGSSDWLMGAVKKNPEGLLLLAAGCALLMRSGRSWTGSASPSASSSRELSGHQPYHRTEPGARGERGHDWSVTDGISRTAETARDYASE